MINSFETTTNYSYTNNCWSVYLIFDQCFSLMYSYPPYPNFPILASGDVILRQVTTADAKEIIDISYYDGVQATTLNQAIEMHERINQDYLQGNSIHWIIVDTQSAAIVGTCGYYRGFADNTGELGYLLKPFFVGKGYMTKALELVISFGKNTIGLKKVIAITEIENIKSQNVLKRLGFTKQDEHAEYITYAY
ncbi:GNAT family N-acetyltransferase [Pedobacter sp. L105]|uniref:GNAT family N-acetyltransferase n=1 Tax=Pedobacter sp. L105 TaxID=1641871 RepID=UPI001C20769D|nr:GNAT family N-acetyltransferase [Pedobacter sp. L105]